MKMKIMIQKRLMLFLFAFIMVSNLAAQQPVSCFENPDGAQIELFVVMTEPPVYGNGKADFSQYLYDRLGSDFWREKQKGEIRLSLIIDPEGKACLQDMSLTEELTISRQQMQEIIATMPAWQSGKQAGKAVYGSVRLRLRVSNEQLYVLEGLPGKEKKVSKKELKRRKKEQERKEYHSTFKDPFESFDYLVKKGGEYVPDSLDQTPVYQGGTIKFLTKLYGIIKYPAEARDKGVQGTVFIEMDLNEFGQVTGTRIKQGIGAGCDEAALSALNGVQPLLFEPAIKDGQAVAVRFEIGVNFKLE